MEYQIAQLDESFDVDDRNISNKEKENEFKKNEYSD